jgi:hypothetical protein
MTEETKMSEVINEVKNASEGELREVIEKWFESTRTAGMKVGATYIAAAVYGAIEKNLKKGSQSSLRDYQRAIKRVVEIVSVQLTQQNDSIVDESNEITNEVVGEATND